MADFDYTDDSFADGESGKKSFSLDMLDIFSILTLVAAACMGAYFLLLFINPYTALNPLPPNTPIPPIIIPSATITPLQLDELWTETPTIQPTITPTSRATFTPISTQTPLYLIEPTSTPKPPDPTATPGMPFTAEIKYVDATIFHPDTNCNWLGVGGVVLDLNGAHYWGVQVRVQGTLVGKTVDLGPQISGTANSFGYGISGFDFMLSDVPLPSDETLFIRIFDQAGLPLSDEIRFSTLADCEKNSVFITFRQVR
ncbi:MAG: hypothetical protein H8E29_01345 [Anaerolineales bacterium]|uniref:Uncharacterized protein n=1 Tax=Candidatus Desulfolinea nitratireducens TaxID=2841698 RepID=A0A8J6TGV5_9CHLR|nr:hypothetical protein [Candidatus Desulfolinea nitratireducens]